MMDSAAFRQLSTGYAAAVDTLDGPAFAGLFTTDGELWVPDLAGDRAPTICRAGSAALERIPSGLARYHATHHRVGPAIYAVEGETGTATVTGVAHHLRSLPDASGPARPHDPGIDVVWYLQYEDEYRRVASGWRIARRVLHLKRIEERPVDHLGPAR